MKDYYATEIANLRELGAEFAKNHPAVAPLLSSRSTDPDVERILEGTAFLCGLVHERLDQNFPEIVQGLLEVTAPALLLPRPSQCLIQFTPDPSVPGRQEVALGTELKSVPVAGASCIYTMVQHLDILPIAGTTVSLDEPGPGRSRLTVRLDSTSQLGQWMPDSIGFFLHDNWENACQWLYYLTMHCSGVTARCGTNEARLDAPEVILPATEAPQRLFSRAWWVKKKYFSLFDYYLLNMFFLLPEVFLFLRVSGLSALQGDDDYLELVFDLPTLPPGLEDPPHDLFRPNTGVAVNVFRHNADPFVLSHTRQEYRLNPQNDPGRQIEIFDIMSVRGIRRGDSVREYLPYNSYRGHSSPGHTYTTRRALSQATGRREFHIGLIYDSIDDIRENETISTEILCYNHKLPSLLHAGDISVPTDSSPAMSTFTNVVDPSPPAPAITDTDTLWQLYSCLHSNLLPLASAQALRDYLQLFLPTQNQDPTRVSLNRLKIDSIRQFSSKPEERLFRGRPMRGLHLDLTLSRDGFANAGEMYILGNILNDLLASYAVINTYTRLTITDGATGERLQWPARLGKKTLL